VKKDLKLFWGRFHLEGSDDMEIIKEQLKTCDRVTNVWKTVLLCGDTGMLGRNSRDVAGGESGVFVDDLIIQHRFKDMWKEFYNLESNPGITYDPENNLMAKENSNIRPLPARDNRCYYDSEMIVPIDIRLIGNTPFGKNGDKFISDHYGIYLKVKFN